MNAAQSRFVAEPRCNPAEEVRAFEAGDIDPQKFDHEAHVRVAWSYLQQHSAAIAIAKFTSALRSLTVRLGASDKYHETISWFFMILIAERSAVCRHTDWQSFKSANPDLLQESSALLKRYYSRDRLTSAVAREHFLLPDRAAET